MKLGGTLLDTVDSRTRLAAEIARLRAEGIDIVVVHGGGKQMTRFLADRGIESRFVNGLRVSTPEVIDAVLKVLAGTVNHELVASLVAAGARAVGLSGIDAGLTQAEPLHAELGAVGRPVSSNGDLLVLLTGSGYLPVVACVAGDDAGRIYNVNADQMAVACAAAFRADALVFLTDVAGVRLDDGTTAPELSAVECRRLIADGVATGGMQAKLNAAVSGLESGVGQVVIAPGAEAGLLAELAAGRGAGTRIRISGAGDA